MYVDTDFRKVDEGVEHSKGVAERGNHLIDLLRNMFTLNIPITRNLLCSCFKSHAAGGRVDVKGFHDHLSREDLLADKEYLKSLEKRGRVLNIEKKLESEPLQPFTPEVEKAIVEYVTYQQFKGVNLSDIPQDKDGKFSLNEEEIRDALIAKHSHELTSEKGIDIHKHGQMLETLFEELLQKTRDYYDGLGVAQPDYYFHIDRNGKVTMTSRFIRSL